ncbi:hypothetical protein, partial [Microvirga arvi]|uniref:hypothetical protein n=1 Tax=Microvirga arvi TaxID=2778731 RepID=UPI001EF5B66F
QPDPAGQAQPDHSLTLNVRSNADYYTRMHFHPCPSPNLIDHSCNQFPLQWLWRATCAMSCLAMPMSDNSRSDIAFNCRAISWARNQRRRPDRTTDKNMTQPQY